MEIESLEIRSAIAKIEYDITNMWKQIYPVGSVYLTIGKATPADLFGGTWEQVGKGRYLLGVDPSDETGKFNASDKTGGSKTHRHFNGVYSINNTQLTVSNKNAASGKSIEQAYTVNGVTGFTSYSGTAAGYGYSTEDAEVQPPFYTVYMWKRTG